MKYIFSLIFLCSYSSLLFSNNDNLKDSTKTKTYYLEPTIITGTRIESSQANVPASVSVIPFEEIRDNSDKSILSLVGNQVPGVFVTERGVLGYGASQGGAGQISIRGISESPNTGVLVLVDGRPQIMGIFGHPFPDTYLSSNTERVEIIRGPSSVLYGSNALGGVINIITRNLPNEGLSTNVNSSYSSFNTIQSDASIGYKFDRYKVFFSYNHDETKGQRDFSGFNMNSGYSKIGMEINENFNLNLDVNLSKFRTFDPGPTSSPLVNNWIEISRGSLGFSVENKFSAFEGGLKVYHNWGVNDVYDGWHSTDRNTNLLLYQTLKLFPENTITLGFDYKYYGGSGENPLTGFFSKNFIEGDHFIKDFGIYALTQQFLFSKMILNAGLRIENNSVFGNELVPQFGLAYHIEETTTIKASVSKGFRSPTVTDLYLFPPRNPDLKPERLWNYEVGMLNNFSNLSLETTFFIAEGSNLILSEGVYPNIQLKNSGEFTHKGIEFLAKYLPADNLKLIVSYTFINPGNETRSNPRHKIFIETNYGWEEFYFDLSLKQIDKMYGDDFSRSQLPDYTIVNAKFLFRPFSIMSVFVSGDNLLNTSYQTIFDYPMPGRTFSVGINFRL